MIKGCKKELGPGVVELRLILPIETKTPSWQVAFIAKGFEMFPQEAIDGE